MIQELTGIKPDVWYSLKDIQKNKWLFGLSYPIILEMVKSGKLKSRNIGAGEKRPTYRISGKSLLKYLEEEDI